MKKFTTMDKALILRFLLTSITTLTSVPLSSGTLYRRARDDYYYRRYGNSYPTAGEDALQIPSPKYIPGSKYPTEGQWVKLEPIEFDYKYKKPPNYHSGDHNSGFRPNSGPYDSGPPYSRPGYTDSRPSYPDSRPSYPDSRPSYPDSRPNYPDSRPNYPDSRPKFFQSDHRYTPSAHGGYPSGPSNYPSAPSYPTSHRPSVSGSGYPYNSGSWNSHHGISSYGWDNKRPMESLCGICTGSTHAVSPQRGEYRGNGYDNLSPEWAIRQMKHHGGGTHHRPTQSDSWNKYPPPADYDRGNAGESGRYPTGSWSSGSGYGGSSGSGAGGGGGGGGGGESLWDKRPEYERRPIYHSRPYDDRKGIYPVKSTPGSGYWDSHPPREIGWDPEDSRIGVVSGWIGGQKGNKHSQGGGEYSKGGYDDYERKSDRYPDPSNPGFGGSGAYDVGKVTSGYVFVPNSIEARPWDSTTKGYSGKGPQSPTGPPSWGSGYDRDYASRWDYNMPKPNRGYENTLPQRGHDRRPDGYDTRPGGYDTKPGGYDTGPGGYDARPGGYDTRPGSYDTRPGGYDVRPGGYDTKPGGYDARPGGHDTRPGGYDSRPAYERRPDGPNRGPEGCNAECGRPANAIPGHDWRESGSSQDGYPSRRPDHSFPPSGPGDYDSSTRFQNDRIPAPPPTRFNGHSGIGASTEYGYLYRGSYQQDRSASTTISSLPISTTIVPSTTLPPE